MWLLPFQKVDLAWNICRQWNKNYWSSCLTNYSIQLSVNQLLCRLYKIHMCSTDILLNVSNAMLYMDISFDEDEQETKRWSEINQYVTWNMFYIIIILRAHADHRICRFLRFLKKKCDTFSENATGRFRILQHRSPSWILTTRLIEAIWQQVKPLGIYLCTLSHEKQ